ncbi:MAG: NifU family protein [Chitinophagales bacterium]
MESTIPKIVEIYTETTPNPVMLKFVTTQMLLPNMILECKSKEEATVSPLAQALFEMEFIDSVFISNNFITLAKKEETQEEWFELTYEIKEFLKQYIKDDKSIVTDDFIAAQKEKAAAKKEEDTIDSKIIALLDKYVKPAVEMDGGHISFQSFNEGTVTLLLQGACSGCPSSSVTLKDGIEAMLKRMLPEVKEVVAEAG